MAKAVFFNIPASGHINSIQGLLTELVKRGDQVTFVNSAEIEDSVKQTGVRFRAYPDSARLRNWLQEGGSNPNFARSAINLLLVAEEFLPFSLELLRDERPDYVITDSITPWGKFAARALNLPLVASISTLAIKMFRSAPPPPMREVAPMMADWLRVTPHYFQIAGRLKRSYDVKAGGLMNVLMTTGDLNLVYTSREFQPAAGSFDESYKFVGAAITERPGAVDFPFDQLTRRPLIYISLGTVNNMNLAFYHQCFAAFADFPAQFILSAGTRTDLQQLGEVPANFIVRKFVPQLDVLKRVDVFITHGGMNSVQEGLLFGVPLVVAPQHMEQAIIAKRVATLGAGVVIGGQSPFGAVTAAESCEAVTRILPNGETAQNPYQQAAQRIGESLKAAGGPQRAADEIQAFLKSK